MFLSPSYHLVTSAKFSLCLPTSLTLLSSFIRIFLVSSVLFRQVAPSKSFFLHLFCFPSLFHIFLYISFICYLFMPFHSCQLPLRNATPLLFLPLLLVFAQLFSSFYSIPFFYYSFAPSFLHLICFESNLSSSPKNSSVHNPPSKEVLGLSFLSSPYTLALPLFLLHSLLSPFFSPLPKSTLPLPPYLAADSVATVTAAAAVQHMRRTRTSD